MFKIETTRNILKAGLFLTLLVDKNFSHLINMGHYMALFSALKMCLALFKDFGRIH